MLHAGTGIRLIVEGPCLGGQVGAAYVRWPDGRRSVLTWRPRGSLADLVQPAAAIEAVRRRGYPAPRTELAEQVGDAVVMVQELTPGAVTHLSGELLDQALALNDLQDRHWPTARACRRASSTRRTRSTSTSSRAI